MIFNTQKPSLILLSLFCVSLIATGCANNTDTSTEQISSIPTATNTNSSDNKTQALRAPISNYESRITLKPFGLQVSPQNSPVNPEKFTGYHTGTDFETFENEANIDVPIYAICSGKLLQKRTASGYGGLVTQSCTINNQVVTVIYGHLKLSSITASTGTQLTAGDTIGVLGKGYSTETDGERKHLHLSIYQDTNSSIAGYVKTEANLNSFIDFETLEIVE